LSTEGETIRILNENLKAEVCGKLGLDPQNVEVQVMPHLIEFGKAPPLGEHRPTPDGYVLIKHLDTNEAQIYAYDHKGGESLDELTLLNGITDTFQHYQDVLLTMLGNVFRGA
jgi:hypothetical protein